MSFRLLLAAVVLTVLVPFHAGAQTQLVVFGDSLSDYGNNGIATSSPTSNPRSQITGVWIKQLANQLALPLTASDDGGTNYARGGAVTSGMTTQVRSYLTAHPTASATALYILWGGGNDINYRAQANPFDATGLRNTAATAVSNIESQIRLLARAGAKYVLWVNMPPLHKTPAALSIPGGLGTTVLQPPSQHFNTLWAQSLARLRTEFPGLTLGGMDVYALFLDITSRPAAYGLTNVTGTAKGKAVNPDTYLFWDEIHPTSYAHGILADHAYELIEDATSILEEEAPWAVPAY
ncbi:SGNH/GDSL hydrolase family protein [Myxococcus qinghaiensis]|uniref:SGNH/GDSL hydrolase family protein n=1 Tax=Myxococcus qinghaiensis TaxID=2906758 RepID=UPI0020A72EA6|nr:SGNH/GDSL hydrolase family protein [Myxococcus qinghaiensis]MCP3161565.1 SGNH/GDSL hydrolase family protein [Myxococcus qinghaiensis]